MHNATAILFFSRSAAADARAKAFGGEARLASALIERTERTLARSGLAVVRSHESNQAEGSFGQRLARAVTGVFDRGYARVIVVGNDCAFLRPSHLRAAARYLENGRSVLGPDQRGGAWMIGLQREDFRAEAFANLRWETADTFDDLAQLLPRVAHLKVLHDVNSLRDLRLLWRFLRSRVGELSDLVRTTLRPFVALAQPPTAGFPGALANRGPPAH